MDLSKSLVCKEPELQKEIKKLKIEVFEKEKELFQKVTDFVSLKNAIKDFYERIYLDRLGKYIVELEELKSKLFGTNERDYIGKDLKQKNLIENNTQNPRIQKELKNIYRKLAKIYHPDKITDKEEKEFLTRRMAEINEAFHRGDIEGLKRYLKRAEAEMDSSASSVERIRYLRLDISVIKDMIDVYVLKINELKKTEMYKLMSKKPEEREKVFSRTEARLKFDIELNKKILKNLGI